MGEHQLVEVTWFDAASDSVDLDISEANKLEPMERLNVGYLLYLDARKLIICFGKVIHCKDHIMPSQVFVIPRALVTCLRYL